MECVVPSRDTPLSAPGRISRELLWVWTARDTAGGSAPKEGTGNEALLEGTSTGPAAGTVGRDMPYRHGAEGEKLCLAGKRGHELASITGPALFKLSCCGRPFRAGAETVRCCLTVDMEMKLTFLCADAEAAATQAITVGGVDKTLPVFVTDEGENLLGLDYLQQTKSELDFRDMTMEIRNRKVPLQEERSDVRVFAARVTRIFSISEANHRCCLSRKMDGEGLISPSSQQQIPEGIISGRSLVPPGKEEGHVVVTNLSSEPQEVPGNALPPVSATAAHWPASHAQFDTHHHPMMEGDGLSRTISKMVEEKLNTEDLICEIEKLPALWDPSCEGYANKIEKQNCWNAIMVILTPDFEEKPLSEKKEIQVEAAIYFVAPTTEVPGTAVKSEESSWWLAQLLRFHEQSRIVSITTTR
ncbi:hypothetical protein O3P69_014597 [Scylla paramamosain]|uniref:MADF domain-containing protein n=1 Tax=Scylla paramamosain TaxID=85552 RepID=A0AAW0TXG4_SCYPA